MKIVEGLEFLDYLREESRLREIGIAPLVHENGAVDYGRTILPRWEKLSNPFTAYICVMSKSILCAVTK